MTHRAAFSYRISTHEGVVTLTRYERGIVNGRRDLFNDDAGVFVAEVANLGAGVGRDDYVATYFETPVAAPARRNPTACVTWI